VPFRDFLKWLDEAGCTVTRVDGVPDHVLVTRGGFQAILPASDPETPRAGVEPDGQGKPTRRYPFTLTDDDDGSVMVTFPDFPGATYGRTREEAVHRARAFVVDALAIYEALDQAPPAPTAIATDQHVVVAVPHDAGSSPGPC
jgi:predicted RNase H-like HicB family nuclease